MPLLLFLLLHQIVLASGSSTYSVVIRRVVSRDSFDLQKSYNRCSSQNECNSYNANFSTDASRRDLCLCSCSRRMAATFGVKNGSWSCIGNKEIRDRELDDCERILLFDNEKETDPLRTLKDKHSATLNISANSQCFQKNALFSCQECDGRWTTLNNPLTDWGLQVTKERSNSVENYMLKFQIDGATRSKELNGKIMKLAIRCGSEKPFCWLFKVAGQIKCPLKHILTNKPPEPKSTATATTTVAGNTTTRKSAFSEAVTSTVHSANSVPKSHVVPIVTSVTPITVISTNKATNTWPTDSNIETIDEGSHEVPITLVIGVAGSAVIVLLLALFFGLLMRRKRRQRHEQKPSTSVELKTTNTDRPIAQYASVKEKSRYQSLSPSPDGDTERGVYVSRYKEPETDVNNMCRPMEGANKKPVFDEYDYAKSSLVVRNNVLKSSFPLSNKETSSTPDDNGPFYHVLDGEDKGLENQEPSEGDCGKPDVGAPYYRVLEGPNPSDQEGNFCKPEHKGGDDVPRELEPFYHILEGPKDEEQEGSNEVAHESGGYYYAVNGPNSSSDSQGGCGYNDLQSEGRVPIEYQALHKYSYVTCGDSSESH